MFCRHTRVAVSKDTVNKMHDNAFVYTVDLSGLSGTQMVNYLSHSRERSSKRQLIVAFVWHCICSVTKLYTFILFYNLFYKQMTNYITQLRWHSYIKEFTFDVRDTAPYYLPHVFTHLVRLTCLSRFLFKFCLLILKANLLKQLYQHIFELFSFRLMLGFPM